MTELKELLPNVEHQEYKKIPRSEIIQWPDELGLKIRAGAIPLTFPGINYTNVCPNCCGSEVMAVYTVTGGPYMQPGFQKSKWLDLDGKEGWYTGETHYAFCPVCSQGRKKEWLMRNSGLDEVVSLEDFRTNDDAFKKKEAKEKIGKLLGMNKNPVGFVTLWGSYGCGKTMLMKALVSGFINIDVPARYITLSDLLAELRWMFGETRGYQKAEEELESYRRFRVLCIDEIDKVNLTGWTKETVNRLMDTRHTARETALTVLATNYSPDNMPAEFGYLKSRMHEGTIVNVPGPDMRVVLGGNG